jgi:hypothetical protein
MIDKNRTGNASHVPTDCSKFSNQMTLHTSSFRIKWRVVAVSILPCLRQDSCHCCIWNWRAALAFYIDPCAPLLWPQNPSSLNMHFQESWFQPQLEHRNSFSYFANERKSSFCFPNSLEPKYALHSWYHFGHAPHSWYHFESQPWNQVSREEWSLISRRETLNQVTFRQS